MSFIGIIAKKKKEKDWVKWEQAVYPNQLLYLAEEDLEHLKNIQFETIMIQDAILPKASFWQILKNCKYVILNSDTGMENPVESKKEQAIITYGYHGKDTVTFSSLTDHAIQICLQRKIQKQSGEWIEPQEIILSRKQNDTIPSLLAYGTLQILYSEKGENRGEIEQNS